MSNGFFAGGFAEGLNKGLSIAVTGGIPLRQAVFQKPLCSPTGRGDPYSPGSGRVCPGET